MTDWPVRCLLRARCPRRARCPSPTRSLVTGNPRSSAWRCRQPRHPARVTKVTTALTFNWTNTSPPVYLFVKYYYCRLTVWRLYLQYHKVKFRVSTTLSISWEHFLLEKSEDLNFFFISMHLLSNYDVLFRMPKTYSISQASLLFPISTLDMIYHLRSSG